VPRSLWSPSLESGAWSPPESGTWSPERGFRRRRQPHLSACRCKLGTIQLERCAGVLVPLFSIRSSASWGLGELPDLARLAPWMRGAGLCVAMTLPLLEVALGQTSPYSAPLRVRARAGLPEPGRVEDFHELGGEFGAGAGGSRGARSAAPGRAGRLGRRAPAQGRLAAQVLRALRRLGRRPGVVARQGPRLLPRAGARLAPRLRPLPRAQARPPLPVVARRLAGGPGAPGGLCRWPRARERQRRRPRLLRVRAVARPPAAGGRARGGPPRGRPLRRGPAVHGGRGQRRRLGPPGQLRFDATIGAPRTTTRRPARTGACRRTAGT
jgi:hypothetical protein